MRPAAPDVILESTLTCPECGHRRRELMPTDCCQWFYECSNCHVILHPESGDCCVFCSYGDVPCPPIQLEQDCCSVSKKGNVMKKLEVFDPAMCCATPRDTVCTTGATTNPLPTCRTTCAHWGLHCQASTHHRGNEQDLYPREGRRGGG